MLKKLFILFFFSSCCYSQTFQNGWSCFEGYIGESDIVMNIFKDSIGNLTGDYCYKKYETRIPLKGKLKDNTLFLDEFTGNKITAKFSGTINEKDNSIGGKWASTTHSDIHFFLRLNSWTGNSLNNRYGLGIKEEEVESFFKNAKQAIITDDKIWLSKNIEFPLTTRIQKKKSKIKNAKDFLAKYNLIITAHLKKSIQKSCICNVFSNWQGTMIADGSIWINEFNGHLKIITINN